MYSLLQLMLIFVFLLVGKMYKWGSSGFDFWVHYFLLFI